jgi:hypothetical protein
VAKWGMGGSVEGWFAKHKDGLPTRGMGGSVSREMGGSVSREMGGLVRNGWLSGGMDG